ncbi:MAG: DUF6695 family protein [Bacteroidota bacterium]|nr:DUF6695 family protein [Bacteroidota bacterium]
MQKDYIITLAWPEGMIASAQSWYDPFFSKKGKYRAGHSAIVLIKETEKKCRFFDFGRYHTPQNTGRVRDVDTDPDLNIITPAIINNSQVTNIKEILREIFNNNSTHGEGTMYAAVIKKINFQKTYDFIKKLQKKGAIHYGPFTYKGLNCSRFVAKAIRKSNPGIITRIRFKYPFCITPSPKRNITISNNTYFVVSNLNIKKIKKNIFTSYITSIEKCH